MVIFELSCDKGHTWTEVSARADFTPMRCPKCKGAESEVSAIPVEGNNLEDRVKNKVLKWVGARGRFAQIVFGLFVTTVGVLFDVLFLYEHEWLRGFEELLWFFDYEWLWWGELNGFFGLTFTIGGLSLVWKAVRGRWGW